MMNEKQQQSQVCVRPVNPLSPVCEHEKHRKISDTSALAFSLHKAVGLYEKPENT